jgi:hypothetical protein
MRFRDRMSGPGRANAAAKLGIPSPELACATGVIVLCDSLLGKLPNPKNRRAQAFCQALLEWAEEDAGRAIRKQPVGWSRHLRQARDTFRQVAPWLQTGAVAEPVSARALEASRLISEGIRHALVEPDGKGYRIR